LADAHTRAEVSVAQRKSLRIARFPLGRHAGHSPNTHGSLAVNNFSLPGAPPASGGPGKTNPAYRQAKDA
jgi:hypothetical protein